MRQNEIVNGFKITRVRPIEELEGELIEMEHLKTGAELVWIKRSEENKTFCVTFKTIPSDDTGVFHIIEHSVLCGSEKYPVKEPFVDLLKGSLNTFLNAMTFPDKTMYPVASRNEADFRNLMRVYLDAVFRPNMLKNKNIFLQEGRHYETDDDGKPRCVGVVFGEMTGAFSSVDEVMETALLRALFPDNCYGFVSGGDPKHIPELTYEQFTETYKRFYHPSNARFFLDGDMDAADILAEIDGEYLSKYERQQPDFDIPMQKPLPYSERRISYAVTPDESSDDRAHFVMGRVIGTWRDVEKCVAMDVVQDYLAGSNSAPLTRAILESGLGEDVRFYTDNGAAQSFAVLQVRNTSEEKLPLIKEKLRETVLGILEKGVPRDELIASLNQSEFFARERQEPYGVRLAISAAQSWLYGGDPMLCLKKNEVYASLREKLSTSYYDDLLREFFLQDDGLAVLNVLPSKTLAAEEAERQQQRLDAEFRRLGDSGREAVSRETKALAEWHETPDSSEATATIPHISVADIPKEPLLTRVEESELDGVRVLRPAIKTSGTVYIDMYFALPNITPEKLSEAALLADLLTELPTKKRGEAELLKAIKTNLGSINFGIDSFAKRGDVDKCVPYFHASVSVLASKTDEAVSLLGEILTSTKLDEREKINEIAKQVLIYKQQDIITGGHGYALRRAISALSAEGCALEHSTGVSCFKRIRDISADFEAEYPALLKSLREILAACTLSNLTLCVVGEMGDEKIAALLGQFPRGEKADAAFSFKSGETSAQAIAIPSNVGYAVKASNLYSVCDEIKGSMAVMSKLVSLDFLWNEIRVKGGAYGAGCNVLPNGMMFCYSYRDPEPSRSLGIYDSAADFLREYCEGNKALDALIIGAVSDSEPLRSAREESAAAAARVLRGITPEDKARERRELLSTTRGDLLECGRIIEAAAKNAGVCVVAGEALLDMFEDEFAQKMSV